MDRFSESAVHLNITYESAGIENFSRLCLVYFIYGSGDQGGMTSVCLRLIEVGENHPTTVPIEPNHGIQ